MGQEQFGPHAPCRQFASTQAAVAPCAHAGGCAGGQQAAGAAEGRHGACEKEPQLTEGGDAGQLLSAHLVHMPHVCLTWVVFVLVRSMLSHHLVYRYKWFVGVAWVNDLLFRSLHVSRPHFGAEILAAAGRLSLLPA